MPKFKNDVTVIFNPDTDAYTRSRQVLTLLNLAAERGYKRSPYCKRTGVKYIKVILFESGKGTWQIFGNMQDYREFQKSPFLVPSVAIQKFSIEEEAHVRAKSNETNSGPDFRGTLPGPDLVSPKLGLLNQTLLVLIPETLSKTLYNSLIESGRACGYVPICVQSSEYLTTHAFSFSKTGSISVVDSHWAKTQPDFPTFTPETMLKILRGELYQEHYRTVTISNEDVLATGPILKLIEDLVQKRVKVEVRKKLQEILEAL